MNFIKNTVKNILVASLLLPGMALADNPGTVFYISNDGASVGDTLIVTEAVLKYAVPSGYSKCTGSIPFSALGLANIKVVKGSPAAVWFNPAQSSQTPYYPILLPDECYYPYPDGYGPERYTLQINSVNNKKSISQCAVSGGFLNSPYASNSGYTIRIIENYTYFSCDT